MFFSRKKIPLTIRKLTGKLILSKIRHMEPSVVCSLDDEPGPGHEIIEIGLHAARLANDNSLDDLYEKKKDFPDAGYYNVFPGEHYRLLHALTKLLMPESIVEIGTSTGMSSACILEAMPKDSRLTTFDLIPWDDFNTHLEAQDFQTGRISQVLEDVSSAECFEKHADLFSQSQMIFCDAPKDGIFEPKFLDNLCTINPQSRCLLILDDIRLLNMIDIWRSIRSPKIDLTSFGHWSGTGLVDISDGLKLVKPADRS